MSRKAISLRLPEELWAAVEARADELGQTRTKFVERALEKALGTVDAGAGSTPASPAQPAIPASSRASVSPSLARFRQS